MNKPIAKYILRAVAFTTIFMATEACQRSQSRPDEHIKTAINELHRLQSYTTTGLDYEQYSDRLLTAKANIDAELNETTDVHAAEKVQHALEYYLHARDFWREDMSHDTTAAQIAANIDTQDEWMWASQAIADAEEYAGASDDKRKHLQEKDGN